MRPFCAVLVALLLLVPSCNSDAPAPAASAPSAGTITTLGEDDVILVSDLLGSPLVEVSGSGKVVGRFSTYPYGATRSDTSTETLKYAASPHDAAVDVYAMGARTYAPNLGGWLSVDPVVVLDPERLVSQDFAAANPYAYAKDSPLLVADRDGHFWHVALGAAIGGLMGGGMEAGRQLLETGRIESWGRIEGAAVGGAVSGTIVAACPIAGLGSFVTVNGAAGAAEGVIQNLVASGGQSAGSFKEIVSDAAMSVATAGILAGGARLAKAAIKRAPAVVRAAPSKVKEAFEGPRCFTGDTLVHAAEGLRPIATLQAGDTILTEDERTGTLTVRPVTRVSTTLDAEVLDLSFQRADGTVETLTATPSHPFWVPGAGWTEARDLALSAAVQTAEGQLATLSAVLSRTHRATVYNLEVAETHTYFVGRVGVWVHNGCRGANHLLPEPGAEGAHVTFRTNAEGKVTNYAEWTPNARNRTGFDEVKRVDLVGGEHYNKALEADVPTPHVQGKGIRGGVRPATPDEIPK